MKTKALIAFLMMLVIAGLLPAAAQAEDSNRFRFLPGITTNDPVTDLVVTPDDRYVLAVSKESQSLKIVDTWDFTLVESATIGIGEGDDKPLCITVSPYGGHAYAGLDSGEVAVIDLDPLDDLLPFEDLEGSLEVDYVSIVDGESIGSITAIPEVDHANEDVYVLMGTKKTLHWIVMTDGKEPGNQDGFFDHEVIALDSVTTRAFELFPQSAYPAGKYIGVINCSQSVGCGRQNKVKTGDFNDEVAGIAVKPGDAHFAVTANLTEEKLMLIDTRVVDEMYVGDTIHDSAFASVSDLALLGGTTSRRAQAMTADGTTVVTVTEVSGSTMEFSGDTADATLEGSTVAPFSSLAASTPEDGYVYAGSDAGHVYPVTANPEVIGLTVLHAYTVTESDGTSIKFKLFMKGGGNKCDYDVYQSHLFGEWGNTLDSGSEVEKGETVTVDIATEGLEECENVITVIGRWEGEEGRDAITVYKDTTPPKPNFSLGFGYEKIIVDFTASFLCDLDHYEIFYGSSLGSTVLDSYTALENSYNKRKISDFSSGEDIEVVIKSLQNEVKYYVYLVIFDKSENYAISNRKSATPEDVITFTEQAGEDGGVDCLGSVSLGPAGGPVKLFGLLSPLLVAGGLLILLRRRS